MAPADDHKGVWMQLVSFDGGFGRIEGDVIVPMGSDLVSYLTTGKYTDGIEIDKEELLLRAPVPAPTKIVCVGLNYKDHAAEIGQDVPDEPVLFAKWANSVVGQSASIEIPAASAEVDYEAELGVVIARTAREVDVDDALDHVAGYTCLNDVTARDLQFVNGGQWTRGKAIDTFLPMGPVLVTPDEVGDTSDLTVRCVVNGEVVQDSSTSQMVFGVAELVSFISRTVTLEPGDVIATGTPPGVGYMRDPQLFLKDGDVVSVEIERIGTLSNPVRDRA